MNNLDDIFTVKYLNGYYRRNRTLINIALVITLFFFIMGYLFFDINSLYEEETLSIENMEESYYNYEEYIDDTDAQLIDSILEDTSLEGFIELFMHNLIIDYTALFGGIFISIPTLIITANNVSMFGGIFSSIDMLMILTSVMPHGIFEIPSSLFALIGGFMITRYELRIIRGILSSHSTVVLEWNNSMNLLKDIILTIIIVFILLLLAAFIETFITPYIILLVYL